MVRLTDCLDMTIIVDWTLNNKTNRSYYVYEVLVTISGLTCLATLNVRILWCTNYFHEK